MLFKSSIVLAGALASCISALPTPACDTTSTTTMSLTAKHIIKVSPATASCDGATLPDECADASRAAIALNKSFETYGVNSTGAQAALLAYTLYESGFKYNKNHFPAPGRPGQGTRMMAMDHYVKLYAIDVVGEEAVNKAAAVGGNEALNAVLALVNSDDEKSFGSAAWFLTTQCSAEVQAGVASESVDGWHAFLTECVGTTVADRDDLWLSAKMTILEKMV